MCLIFDIFVFEIFKVIELMATRLYQHVPQLQPQFTKQVYLFDDVVLQELHLPIFVNELGVEVFPLAKIFKQVMVNKIMCLF